MKTNVLFVMCLVAALMVSFTVAPQSESNDQIEHFYKTCLEKKISTCRSKMMLKSSRSANLRKTSALAAEQAVFYLSNKDMLVKEMMELEIDRKSYKVDYYLIKRFHAEAKHPTTGSIAAK